MPTRILQVTSTGTVTANVSMPINGGVLEAVTISLFEQTVPPGFAFARVVLQTGDNELNNTIAVLLSGYPSTGNPIGWIGQLHLEVEDRITFYVTGVTNTIARCAVRIYHPDND